MSTTHRSSIAARVGQSVATTTLIVSIAIGAAASAGALPYNRDAYYRCIINGGYIDVCCINANGETVYDQEGHPYTCWEPLAKHQPGEPAPTQTPPVVQNPPGEGGPSNPLIPDLRGPNHGSLG